MKRLMGGISGLVLPQLALALLLGILLWSDDAPALCPASMTEAGTCQAGGSGDVTGPASSTDNAVARFDGTGGKTLQDSVWTVADTTGDLVCTAAAGTTTALKASKTTGFFQFFANSTTANGPYFELYGDNYPTREGGLYFGAGQGNGSPAGIRFYDYNGTSWDLNWQIDPSGNLLHNGASAADYDPAADDFVLKRTGDAGMTIHSGTVNVGAIYFADGTTADARYRGQILYNHASDSMAFYAAATKVATVLGTQFRLNDKSLALDSSGQTYLADSSGTMLLATGGVNRVYLSSVGNVGIGGTPGAGAKLYLTDSTNDFTLEMNRPATNKWSTVNFKTAGSSAWAFGLRETGDNNLHFYNYALGGNAFLLEDTTGRVGINDSTPDAQLDVTLIDAATVGQVIDLAASQTADAWQVKDSSANVLAAFNKDGQLLIGVTPNTHTIKGSGGTLTILGSSAIQLWGSGKLQTMNNTSLIFEKNNYPIQQRDSGATARDILNLDASDVLQIGGTGIGAVNVNNALDLADPGSKPTCDSTQRGRIWYDEGGAGVADTAEICAKNSSDTYAWYALATIP